MNETISEQDDYCDACGEPWEVKFSWTYTGREQYCSRCLLEPVEGQGGKLLLDFMPGCDVIVHRVWGRQVLHHSLATLYPVLSGRLA